MFVELRRSLTNEGWRSKTELAAKKAEPLLALLSERRVRLFVDRSFGLSFGLSFQVTISTGTLPL
jgi:hypothetical protein